MVAKAQRGSLADAGLVRRKPGSASSVTEAPMDPDADATKEAQSSQVTHIPEPTAVKAEEPKPTAAQVEPQAPTFEPEPERQQVRQVEIQPSQPDAALNNPSELQVVRIAAPVHARKKRADQIQLSVKLKGSILERFEKARFETGLAGQDIGVEAIEIWLAHNGF